jgi:hypothetical protein
MNIEGKIFWWISVVVSIKKALDATHVSMRMKEKELVERRGR